LQAANCLLAGVAATTLLARATLALATRLALLALTGLAA